MAKRDDGPRVLTLSCVAKGKRCVAIAVTKDKWEYLAHSEVEAELMRDAVSDRGYVLTNFWRRIIN